MSEFIGLDGQPCEFSDYPTGEKLISCIAGLEGAEKLTADQQELFARKLFDAADYGREGEMPRNRFAGMAVSEFELRKLEKQTQRLLDSIRGLRAPAYRYLEREDCDICTIQTHLEELLVRINEAGSQLLSRENEAELHAEFEATTTKQSKLTASYVTEEAGFIFQRVTGKRPTIVTNSSEDLSGHPVSGRFYDFVLAVFDALGIDASAESQIRATLRKKPSKKSR